jgi:type IV fimbrial biogenesis protein FimT
MDRPATDGLSLWELLWCLGIASVLLALAVPSFADLLLDSRRRADINAFVTAIQLARSEAAKRGQAIVLCKTRDGAVCGGDEIRYDSGWMVFANVDDDRPPRRGPADALLLRHRPASTGPITSNRRLYEFRAFGWRSTNGTVTFCDRRGLGRAVIVSYTGRPRVADIGPGGRPLVCGI